MGREFLSCPTGSVLVLMCGLPGSGKSTIARALARRVGALHWDKDTLRELLFPADRVVYDRELNDLCMELLYAAARSALATRAAMVILDGRPFAQERQRERAREAADQAGAASVFVLCSAPMDVLRRRIASDAHIAPNRDEVLLERLAIAFEPMTGNPIRIDTAAGSVYETVDQCIAGLQARGFIAVRTPVRPG
jgi:predicted kinase